MHSLPLLYMNLFLFIYFSHLHFLLQSASIFQERLHHLLCDWEVWGKFGAALDDVRVSCIQKLESEKLIFSPVFCNILWRNDRSMLILNSWPW